MKITKKQFDAIRRQIDLISGWKPYSFVEFTPAIHATELRGLRKGITKLDAVLKELEMTK